MRTTSAEPSLPPPEPSPAGPERSLPSRGEMQRALLAADQAYDGIFLAGVRTTGIFCRPSCRARKPRPENVEFFGTPREALFAGYRPCLRCAPLAAPGARPEWVESLLARVQRNPEERLKQQDLRLLGVDPARARRYFVKHFGMTFHAYARGMRLSRALRQIRAGAPLDDVALGHGFESHSGFRAAFGRAFGRPPGRSRSTEAVITAWIETPLGPMLAGATDAGVCLLEFSDRRMLEAQFDSLRRRVAPSIVPGDHRHLRRLRRELARYFAGGCASFEVPLVTPGTPFEERVWAELRRIPNGETCSYAELARRVGCPGGARAVGRANGMNRVAIVIPCHRVVNRDGELGAYGGGLWRKRRLLDLERRGPTSSPGGRDPSA